MAHEPERKSGCRAIRFVGSICSFTWDEIGNRKSSPYSVVDSWVEKRDADMRSMYCVRVNV